MINRRRMLSIIASTAALPLSATLLPIFTSSAIAKTTHWKGVALGAETKIILEHENANVLIKQALLEINRLENIFSLYKANSELSLLNQNGKIANPSFELLELLSLCSQINHKTAGAFDPSIQALWELYAKAYSQNRQINTKQLSQARRNTGWQFVSYSASEISFKRKGVKLTLNGIAQGYIADKIRDLFKRNGVKNVLVNTGEIASIGTAPSGKKWRIHLKNKKSINMPLTDGAIATSAPLGTSFDQNGKIGHILDPRTGKPSKKWKEVSVITNSAALADGLSTGFSLMNKKQIIQAKGEAEVLLS